MTEVEHTRAIIGDQVLMIAKLAAQVDALKENLAAANAEVGRLTDLLAAKVATRRGRGRRRAKPTPEKRRDG